MYSEHLQCPIVGQNHVTQSLFYNKVLNISCNLLNIETAGEKKSCPGTEWL